jgi:hypothetical protein
VFFLFSFIFIIAWSHCSHVGQLEGWRRDSTYSTKMRCWSPS